MRKGQFFLKARYARAATRSRLRRASGHRPRDSSAKFKRSGIHTTSGYGRYARSRGHPLQYIHMNSQDLLELLLDDLALSSPLSGHVQGLPEVLSLADDQVVLTAIQSIVLAHHPIPFACVFVKTLVLPDLAHLVDAPLRDHGGHRMWFGACLLEHGFHLELRVGLAQGLVQLSRLSARLLLRRRRG